MSSSASLARAVRTLLLACSIAGTGPLVAQQQAEMAPQAAARVANTLVGRPTAGDSPTVGRSKAPTLPGVGTTVWPSYEHVATRPVLGVVAVQERARGNTHLAMMGVGATAVVAGLIIGGDDGTILATVGGVVGLVGLFRYLR